MKHIENVRAITERIARLIKLRADCEGKDARRDCEQRIYEDCLLLEQMYNINLFDILGF